MASDAPTLEDYQDLRARPFGTNGRGAAALDRPRVTIITVVFNARQTIERTIDSVQEQDFQDFEHVIVDGGSSDGTQDVLRARVRPHDIWISEPDRGISDAFNKGVALARGDAVQFLNADDWLSSGQLAIAVDAMDATDADFVFGDLIFHQAGKPAFRYRGEPDYARWIHRHMPPLNHPTALIKRQAFERVGLFDLNYRCAMDYEWFLRLHVAGGQGVYIPELVGNMTHEGVSNINYQQTFREVERIAVAYGRPAALARVDSILRFAKTTFGKHLEKRAAPLYKFVRARLNHSYQPLSVAETGLRDAESDR
ncbi:MAG: glycosyltransferase family 2 protein [Geminicoccaceae bacterium]